MRLKPLTYTHTLHACYGGYIVQAIIANLAPLFSWFSRPRSTCRLNRSGA